MDLGEALVIADRFPCCIPEGLAALEVLNPELTAALRMARTPRRMYRLLKKADDSDSMQLNLAIALLSFYGLPSPFEPAPSSEERFPDGFLDRAHEPLAALQGRLGDAASGPQGGTEEEVAADAARHPRRCKHRQDNQDEHADGNGIENEGTVGSQA